MAYTVEEQNTSNGPQANTTINSTIIMDRDDMNPRTPKVAEGDWEHAFGDLFEPFMDPPSESDSLPSTQSSAPTNTNHCSSTDS